MRRVRKPSNRASLFDGTGDLEGASKDPRLKTHVALVYEQMSDGRWYSLTSLTRRISELGVNISEAGVSARIRDLRKARFGGFDIEKKYSDGLHYYKLHVRTGDATKVYKPDPQRSQDTGCKCDVCRQARHWVRQGHWVWVVCGSGNTVKS